MDTKAFFTEGRAALVLIDLQRGIVGRATAPHSSASVVASAAQLVDVFHAAALPVVFVRVAYSADRGDALAPMVDDPPPSFSLPPGWSDLVPELGVRGGDIIVTKRNWGAFYGTELDLQLRRRGVKQIVLGGISTNIGVESTARDAYERGYRLLFAEDAMAAMSAEEHAHSLTRIFTRIGIVRTTGEVSAALARA